ncbi:MAG: lysine-sensitive aspartokinase 3 [Acidobacteria bacterium]|nr:lysine-sensitive aspartokinase 3 [Acidobacteriota bacterium]
MIVLKFGGTSVADAERMLSAAALVRDCRERRPVVVVSALGGVTDALIKGAEVALRGDESALEPLLAQLRDRHDQMGRILAERAGEDWQALRRDLEPALERISAIYRGLVLLRELSPRVSDLLAGLGEILSSRLMVYACRAQGVPAAWVDPREWLLTNEEFGRAQPLWEEVRQLVGANFPPIVQNHQVPVTGGFVGSTLKGTPTTLGRGGSDFSAAILGVCLEAEEIQIWTDVDGMMTSDPRVVPEARLLEEISFDEASELAYFGAKVLHPSTIKPAMEAGIPVRVLNTLKPKMSGTRITASGSGERIIRAIATKKGITGITLSSPRMLMAHGFLAFIFQVFDKYSTAVDLVATSEVSVSLTVDDVRSLELIRRDLQPHCRVVVQRDLAVISVVGRNFLHQTGVAGRVFGALREINLLMVSFGASDINLSFVVKQADADTAVRLLHRELLEPATVAHL